MQLKQVGRWLWIWGLVLFSVLYGHYSKAHHIFPSPQVEDATQYVRTIVSRAKGTLRWYYIRTKSPRQVILRHPEQMAPGLTLVTGLGPNGRLFAKLVQPDGSVAHSWDLDFHKVWPDPRGVPPERVPKERPGTLVHGILLSSNGDLTFNYERIGTVQLDLCGRAKWRLARASNHSLFRDDDGHFWTQELILQTKPSKSLPNYAPKYNDYVIMELSPEGKLLRRISIFDLLQRNHLHGLLYLSSIVNRSTVVTGDTLHVNDIEVFPKTMKPDLFSAGDVMVSLRNINAVIVFDPKTLVVKQMVIGHFVRQHDPDFVDGSTISVLDNNLLSENPNHGSSRIVEHSFKTGEDHVVFEGSDAHPFYTDFMGKHQRLANGNWIVAESTKGRALEINPKGEVIWEYFNVINPTMLGMLSDAQRIPLDTLSPDRLKQLTAACHS